MPQMTPLKQARLGRGVQSKQVAEALGISEQYYSEIENGHTPSFRTAKKIAEYLGMPIGRLFAAYDVSGTLNSGGSALDPVPGAVVNK